MRLLVPAVAAAAVLVLAGCSDPEPGSPLPTGGAPVTSALPSETASATLSTGAPAPTPGVTETPTTELSEVPTAAPTLPPEAMTNDAAGAEAFVRYWYGTLNYAFATGDTGPLLDASADDCEACAGLAGVVEEAYAQGGGIRGGEITLREVVSPTPDATGAVLLSVVFDQAKSTRFDGRGEAVDEEAASENLDLAAVIQRREAEATWIMFGLAK